MENTILQTLAPKLGISCPKTIRKAGELMRLAEVKSSTGSLAALNLTGSCRAVLCLDLAADAFDIPITKDTAIKLAGVNKKIYTNTHKAFESILDLGKHVTIRDIAIQFGCTTATSLAQQVLQRYEAENEGKLTESDLGKPLFQTAALYTVCKRLKQTINKVKLLEVAGGKKTTFDKLVAQMDKIAEKLITNEKTVKGKRQRTLADQVEERSLGETPDAKVTRADEKEDDDDDYEEWKRNILEKARIALASS